MKNLLLCLLASVMIIFLAVRCKNNSGNVTLGNGFTKGIPKNDTSWVTGAYKNRGDSLVYSGEFRKVKRWGFGWVNKDSSTMKKEWMQDSLYIIVSMWPIINKEDSATARSYGTPVYDTLNHRPGKIPKWANYPPRLVRDAFGQSLDSAKEQLKREHMPIGFDD